MRFELCLILALDPSDMTWKKNHFLLHLAAQMVNSLCWCDEMPETPETTATTYVVNISQESCKSLCESWENLSETTGSGLCENEIQSDICWPHCHATFCWTSSDRSGFSSSKQNTHRGLPCRVGAHIPRGRESWRAILLRSAPLQYLQKSSSIFKSNLTNIYKKATKNSKLDRYIYGWCGCSVPRWSCRLWISFAAQDQTVPLQVNLK